MAAATPETSGQSRKVLDEARITDSGFDEEVLSELNDEDFSPASSSGDKVELDKADLPLAFEEEPEPEPEPELEVDLADEPGMPPMEGEEEEPKSKIRRYAFLGIIASIAIGLGLGLWYGLLKPEERVKTELPPWFFQGVMPDPDKMLQIELEPFIVPLLASEEGSILRIAVTLESPDDEAKLLLADKIRLLRDVIYRILRDRPAGEIMTYKGKKLLQAQIKSELNNLLNQDLVHQVLFTEFVVTG